MIDPSTPVEVVLLEPFRVWLEGLRDKQVQAAVAGRLRRMEKGNAGDAKGVGGGISEMRTHLGPGYRFYHVWRGNQVVVLLCAGDKSSQDRDIAHARRLAEELG